jgi:nucleotide-binding universal stress UspA family protein
MKNHPTLIGTISKILVLSDGSKKAKKAIAYAVDLAKHLKASIIALNLIDQRLLTARTVYESDTASPTLSIEDYLKEVAERHTGEIKQLCDERGVEATVLIQTGHPASEIVKEAKRFKADLIVMGAQEKSDIPETVLGNVSYGVIGGDIGWCRIL